MDDLSKKIQKKYIDDISQKYPIHRFFCLFIYLLGQKIYSTQESANFIDEISKIKINYMFDFQNGVLSDTTVYQLFLAIFFVLITSKISYFVKSNFFNLFSRLDDFQKYVIEIKSQLENSNNTRSSTEWVITTDISKKLEIQRVKIKGHQATTEILITIIACIIFGWNLLQPIDYFLLLLGFIIITYTQWESFIVYVKDFLPYFAAEQSLLGKDIEFSKQGKQNE